MVLSKPRYCACVAIAFLILSLTVRHALGVTKTWNDGNGNWSTSGNWTPSGVPGAGDVVNVTVSDPFLSRTITYDYTGTAITLNSLSVDNVGAGTPTLSMAANVLTSSGNESIGNAGRGAINQSGGTNTVTGSAGVVLGNAAGAIGTYNLNGSGGLNTGGTINVGQSGTGTFSQTGGIATASGGLAVGFNASGNGTYTLSSSGTLNGGAMSVQGIGEVIGYFGVGSFNQNGGLNIIYGNSLNIGNASGSLGTYSMTNGALAVHNYEYVGYDATGNVSQSGGTFTQSGGTHTIYDFYPLSIGANSGSKGSYTLSGTGTLVTNGAEFVGGFGAGTFTQTGGSNTASGPVAELDVGTSPGSVGTYALSGGTLTMPIEFVGANGTGTFNQTGGTNTITEGNNGLIIAGSGLAVGTYNLSAGTTSIVGSTFVGGSFGANGGKGILNVSGSGVMTIGGALTVYNTPNSAINLSGGAINTAALNFNGTPSLFHWTGGTINLTSNVTWDSAAAGTTTSGAFGSSLALASGQTLTASGNETLGGTGAFALTLNSGSTHNVTGNLTISSLGTISQNSGSTLNATTITQAGGTVNGTLQNQGNFVYQSGLFNGRLLNQGTVSLGTAFTAGNGLENDTTMTVGIGQTVTLNGAGLDNHGLLFLNGGTLNISSFNNSGTFKFLDGTLGINQAGASIGLPFLTGSTTTINVNANNVSLGNSGVFTGFNHQGVLNVFGNTVTLNSAGYAKLGVLTSLDGGTINAPNGVALGSGSNLQASGSVNTRVAGELGSVIQATGALALGDAASPAGYSNSGELRTQQFTVTLNSSAPVGLGNLTMLGAGANPGVLAASNGFIVDFDGAVTGYGTIDSINTLAKHATVNGTVHGNSPGQPITFSGYIKGTGSFNNVNFTGTYSPGLSPAIASVGNISLAGTSTLVMEIGGTDIGSQYDAILSDGSISLGGTLAVSFINGFNPVAGNSFNLFDWANVIGTFSTLQLPALGSGLSWNTSELYTSGVLGVTLTGDYSDNGTVDAADYVVWRKGFGATYTQNDYDAWRAHFGQTAGSGSRCHGECRCP